MRWPGRAILAAMSLTLAAPAPGDGPKAPPAPAPARVRRDAPYKPTGPDVIAAMLDLAEIRPGEVLYDLGSGDGRIVIEAARRFGIKAVGLEIDPALVRTARENAAKAGVGHLVAIRQGDIFEADFNDADVVTLYLLPDVNARLRPKLAKLKPGSRILSNSFAMKGAKPDRTARVPQDRGVRIVRRWVVPWASE